MILIIANVVNCTSCAQLRFVSLHIMRYFYSAFQLQNLLKRPRQRSFFVSHLPCFALIYKRLNWICSKNYRNEAIDHPSNPQKRAQSIVCTTRKKRYFTTLIAILFMCRRFAFAMGGKSILALSFFQNDCQPLQGYAPLMKNSEQPPTAQRPTQVT